MVSFLLFEYLENCKSNVDLYVNTLLSNKTYLAESLFFSIHDEFIYHFHFELYVLPQIIKKNVTIFFIISDESVVKEIFGVSKLYLKLYFDSKTEKPIILQTNKLEICILIFQSMAATFIELTQSSYHFIFINDHRWRMGRRGVV